MPTSLFFVGSMGVSFRRFLFSVYDALVFRAVPEKGSIIRAYHWLVTGTSFYPKSTHQTLDGLDYKLYEFTLDETSGEVMVAFV